MSEPLEFRRHEIAIIGLVATILFVAAFKEPILLFAATKLSEKRPELLSDAAWKQPDSAQKFARRFMPGRPESDLIAWLSTNDFSIAHAKRKAFRAINGFPCTERIYVAWSADDRDILESSSVTISEAGCL